MVEPCLLAREIDVALEIEATSFILYKCWWIIEKRGQGHYVIR
jgi:hypothetical protein